MRKHNGRFRNNHVLHAVLILIAIFLGTILVTLLYPQRYVGILAWAGYVIAIVFYFICFIVLAKFCFYSKLRERAVKIIKEEPKGVSKVIVILIVLAVCMLCLLMGYLALTRAIPLVKDIYSGPVHHQIERVNVQDIKKNWKIKGRPILGDFKKISIKTKDGDFIQIDLRIDEWEMYGSELKVGEDFIYYPNLKIWQP